MNKEQLLTLTKAIHCMEGKGIDAAKIIRGAESARKAINEIVSEPAFADYDEFFKLSEVRTMLCIMTYREVKYWVGRALAILEAYENEQVSFSAAYNRVMHAYGVDYAYTGDWYIGEGFYVVGNYLPDGSRIIANGLTEEKARELCELLITERLSPSDFQTAGV